MPEVPSDVEAARRRAGELTEKPGKSVSVSAESAW